ncbi:response regulator transcription factor [Paraburkholderia sp. J11-2]|uniref:response regulator transcription factor n=1 Tax=Paraburkholderia sp. J11-2 TaxID=2805431 RepID=UPI002AB7DA17|nr:response regulator transcription factor [Paraburkholderia sp. J11-2]
MISTKKECRVIIADDHPFVTAGIKHFLAGSDSLEIIGTAHDSGEIVELLDHIGCDILISDYSMPNGKYGDGIKFLSFLRRRYPNLNIIVYTVIEEPTLLTKISRLGIRSVVDKSSDMEMLLSAINAVRAIDQRAPRHVAAARVESSVAHGQQRVALSPQEAEVVRLFISGLTVDEIARTLCRSKKTISTQKNAAKNKLGIKRDVELYRLFLGFD